MKAGIIGFGTVLLITVMGIGYYTYYNRNADIMPIIQGVPPVVQPDGYDSDTNPIPDSKIEKQASFAIFTNGTFRIFTNSMYHNLSEDIYIESSNPNIVQIKKEDLTWRDFFETLPFKLTSDCLTTGTGQVFCSGNNGSLKFYINEVEDKDALSKVINDGDKLLVSFGNEDETQVNAQFEKIPNP